MRAAPRMIAVLVLAGAAFLATGTMQPGRAGSSDDKLPPPKAGAKQPATLQYEQLPQAGPQPGMAARNAPALGTFETREAVSLRNRLDDAARGRQVKPIEMGTASKHVQKLPPRRADPKPIDNGPERMAPKSSRRDQPKASAGNWPEPTTSSPLRQRATSAATPGTAATPAKKASHAGPIVAPQASSSAVASTSRRAAPSKAGANAGPGVAALKARLNPSAVIQAGRPRSSNTAAPVKPGGSATPFKMPGVRGQ